MKTRIAALKIGSCLVLVVLLLSSTTAFAWHDPYGPRRHAIADPEFYEMLPRVPCVLLAFATDGIAVRIEPFLPGRWVPYDEGKP